MSYNPYPNFLDPLAVLKVFSTKFVFWITWVVSFSNFLQTIHFIKFFLNYHREWSCVVY